jgi:hypothetical protein
VTGVDAPSFIATPSTMMASDTVGLTPCVADRDETLDVSVQAANAEIVATSRFVRFMGSHQGGLIRGFAI